MNDEMSSGLYDLALVLEDEVRVAHVLLDPRDDPVRLDLGRLLGGVADDDVVAVEQDDRRRDPLALLVGDDDGLAVLVHVGDRRIGRPQVDPVDALAGPRSRQGLPWLDGLNTMKETTRADRTDMPRATRHGGSSAQRRRLLSIVMVDRAGGSSRLEIRGPWTDPRRVPF